MLNRRRRMRSNQVLGVFVIVKEWELALGLCCVLWSMILGPAQEYLQNVRVHNART
jgi:hypothetical protein